MRPSPPSFVRAALVAASLWLVGAVAGCGNEDAISGIPAGVVGQACQSADECGFGAAMCLTQFPGGYCTADCPSVGCPTGSVCGESGGRQVCIDTCTTNEQCRNGYWCAISAGAAYGFCDAVTSGPDPDAGDDASDAVDDTDDAGSDADEDVVEDTTADDAVDTTPDDVTADATGDTTTDTGTTTDSGVDTGSGADTAPDVVEPATPIGSTCVSDEECELGPSPQCVTWLPEGYCSSGCETDADCGAGNFCASAGFGPTLCLDGCSGDGDCRDGFGCCGWAGGACLPSWACF